MKKFYESLKMHPRKINYFEKKKNEVINKWAAVIIWKCEILWYF